MDVGGSPSSVMGKGQHWHKNLRARTTRFHKETACSVIKKKMFYINENKTMNKAYQSLPFLRSTLKALMK
jgi:hypothetical protein